MKKLFKALVLLFVADVAVALVMCAIGLMYNLPGSGTTFDEVLRVSIITLVGLGGLIMFLMVYTLLFKPEYLD